jgi:nucleoside-diphosphate-sugar epimerase
MRIAVTGGAGYIGSVVTEVLIQDGHAVLVLDRSPRGSGCDGAISYTGDQWLPI